MDKVIVKCIRKDKGTKATKTILKNTNKVGGMSLLDFKTYVATVMKTVWYWQRNRHKDKWNRIETPEIDLHIHAKLIYDKLQKQFSGCKIAFSTYGSGATGHPWWGMGDLNVNHKLKYKTTKYFFKIGENLELKSS